jgi:hypothetical protein
MSKAQKAYPILKDTVKNGLATLLVERNWVHHKKKCHYVEVIDHATGIRKEHWFEDGVWHREDGPAVSDWLKTGEKYAESWHIKGNLHRQGGPAISSWWDNGGLRIAVWFRHGGKHRSDGPSTQSWDRAGRLIRTEWHVHGHAIGDQVAAWIADNDIPPDFQAWSDDHHAQFTARFADR